MTDGMNSVRCKACDKPFSSQYDHERKRWEDLCWECLAIAFSYDLPNQDTEGLEQLLDNYTREDTDYGDWS
jgi:hypothetical protein